MDVHGSIDIEAPAERVWPFLVEPDKVLRWYQTLTEFTYLDERRGPGTHVYIEERTPGPTMKVDFEASEWLDRRLIAYHMTAGSGVHAYDQRWSLLPSDGGCRFTFDEHVELPFGAIGRMLGAVGRRTSERHLEKMLATLKSLAERAGDASAPS